MDSGHVKALETRLRWLRWARESSFGVSTRFDRSAKDPRSPYRSIMPTYETILAAGDTFFMNRRFCELVNHARQSIPDDVVFENSWLQSRQGWMWIEQPFDVPMTIEDDIGEQPTAIDHIQTRISAIGWAPIAAGTRLPRGASHEIAGDGAVEFACFQDFSIYDEKAVGFGCWSYFSLQNGDKLIDRIHQFEFLAKHDGGAYSNAREADMLHEIRWIFSALHLMSQRLAVTVNRNTDRSIRRRHEREAKGAVVPSFIRIITLRRLEEDRGRAEKEGAVPVDWQWQWEVRGHWRNQWFASEGVHKQIFIEAFIKGPDDKPLKPPGHKMFLANR